VVLELGIALVRKMVFVLELAVGDSRLRGDSGGEIRLGNEEGGSEKSTVLWINLLTGRSLSEGMYVEKTYDEGKICGGNEVRGFETSTVLWNNLLIGRSLSEVMYVE
jgi:hypothetical protein